MDAVDGQGSGHCSASIQLLATLLGPRHSAGQFLWAFLVQSFGCISAAEYHLAATAKVMVIHLQMLQHPISGLSIFLILSTPLLDSLFS